MRTGEKSDQIECRPLIAAATRHLFQSNPFRITGLAVDATTREITKHADKIKLMEELGDGEKAHTTALARKPPPTLDEIREAIQRLKDPEARIVDEFFWFWPQEFGHSKSDPAIQALAAGNLNGAIETWRSREKDQNNGAAASHNIALAYHVTALDWENYAADHAVEDDQRQKIAEYWQRAFRRWKLLSADDRLWDNVVARIHQIDDARLTTGFARRMQCSLPKALNKINVEVALAYAEAGKFDQARLHVQTMRETGQRAETWEETAELVLTPTKNRLKEQIHRANERAARKPTDAANAARELLAQAKQCLEIFNLFFDKTDDIRNELFDEVVSTCNQLQVTHHKATGDNNTCLQILSAVLPFAASPELEGQIEKNIATLHSNIAYAKLGPVFALLKSIQDSHDSALARLDRFQREAIPALAKASYGVAANSESYSELSDSAAIVLRGISLDAWNKYQDKSTAAAAHSLALQYVRGSELKSRLTDDATQLQRMEAERRQKRIKNLKDTAIGWLVFIGAIWLISQCSSSTSSNGGSSGGNTYRVPSHSSSDLSSDRNTIETAKANLNALDSELQSMGNKIESERLSIDSTSQFAVDQFNQEVARYNAKLEQAKADSQALNTMVDNYNAKLRQPGR